MGRKKTDDEKEFAAIMRDVKKLFKEVEEERQQAIADGSYAKLQKNVADMLVSMGIEE